MQLWATHTEPDEDELERAFVAILAEEIQSKLPAGITASSSSSIIHLVCPNKENLDCPSTKYRSISGYCNNVKHTGWGARNSKLQRELPPRYDPETERAPATLPSARLISSSLFSSLPSSTVGLTQLLPHFAHFVFADLVQLNKPRITTNDGRSFPLPCCDSAMSHHPECAAIDVPANDTKYAGFVRCIAYTRTLPAPRRECEGGEREQANGATAFLDGEGIYGSQADKARKLRNRSGGQLSSSYSSSPYHSLPVVAPDCPFKSCFLTGSSHVNFLPSSAALTTVFQRQHNRVAHKLQELNPSWSDAQLFEEARRIVIAQLQHVTYDELLPAILGRETWAKHSLRGESAGYSHKYDMDIDASAINSFAAAAGQFFFTMFSPRLSHQTENGDEVITRQLSEIFNDPAALFLNNSIAGVVRFLIRSRVYRPGLHMSEELRDRLFRSLGNLGLDQAALIIQTGRDHGLPPYTEWRHKCSGVKITSFGQLRNDLTDGDRVVDILEGVYNSVDKVDLFVLGLAEKPLPGGLVGPTFGCIIGKQFQKTKQGDRFWYENDMAPSQFTEQQLMEIRKSSLARILCENAGVDFIQPRALEIEDEYNNAPISCSSSMLRPLDLTKWKDFSALLDLPVTPETVRAALEIGRREVEERRRREEQNINRNQGIFRDGDPLMSYGKMMRAKREALELSKISSILLATSHVLMTGRGLEGQDGFPIKLNRDVLQKLLPQIDVSGFVGNFTALLGPGGSINRCLPKNLPCDHTSPYRTHSGWCNNLQNPSFGNSFGPLMHLLKPAYDDGMDAPRSRAQSGGTLPNPRLISNAVHLDLPYDHKKYTLMIMQFGQVLDHELTHSPVERGPNDQILNCTRCDSSSSLSVHCMPLAVPENDAHFPTHEHGERRCLPFARSLLGQLNLGYRNQLNQLTAFLDGSVIYGATKCEADSLRMYSGGKMNFTDLGDVNHEALPQGLQEQDCRSSPRFMCFVAGDERNSHQPALTAMHNMLLREHNRVATELARLNPHWDDERLYQESRKIVSAQFNHITFNEYVPKLIGMALVEKFDLAPRIEGYFQDYNSSCDASISQPFATAAFRFGHTLIRRMFPRMDSAFHNMSAPVDLVDHFNNVEPVYNRSAGGIDSLIMGLIGTPSMAFDRHITDAVRNHLFGRRGEPKSGMDLITINILRARDHGVQPYNDFREFCGLRRARSFADLSPSMDQTAISALQKVYDHVDDIDLFPGLLSEIPIKGALMPPTMACLIAEQFSRLKKCDRFHYENDLPYTKFSREQLDEIRKVRLGALLCANAKSMTRIQPDVFIMPDELINAQVPCSDFPKIDLTPWTDRPTCFVSDRHLPRGKTMKKSPCTSCTCTADGPRCRSLVIGSCKQLFADFNVEEIKKARDIIHQGVFMALSAGSILV